MGPIPNLEKHDMKYTVLDRDGIQATLPFQNLPEEWVGIDMPDNGYINVPLLLRTLHHLCHKHGVDLFDYATVKSIQPDLTKLTNWVVQGERSSQNGASGLTTTFAYGAKKIAITPGAYVNQILFPSFKFTLNVHIWEMVSYSYDFM